MKLDRVRGIKGKWIVEDYENVHENATLILQGDRVKEIVGNDELNRYEDLEILDKSDSVVMPGFVNSHMHMYGVLAHGIPQLQNFNDFTGFLENYWWPYIENRLGLEEVKTTTEYRCRQLLGFGVTSVCDVLEAPNVPEDTLIEQANIIDEYGINAILSLESSVRVDEENGQHCLDENIRLADWVKRKDTKVKAMMCTHTTFTCPEDFIKKAQKMANDNDIGLQFHMSESSYEPECALRDFDKRPGVYLDDMGILNSDVIASQCVKVDEEEIDILHRNDVKVAHNPLSNCEVGGGFAPVVEMLDKGINVSLGTDGYIDDFFEVMRAAFLVHKGVHENTEVMPADIIFKMATENGAKTMKLEGRGTLSDNSYADLIVLKDDIPTPINKDNIFDLLVLEGRSEYIDQVYIDGEKKVDAGQVLIGDGDRISSDLLEVAGKFWDF